MFISNNRPSFHLWWKENLVKHQKVSKCCKTDCLQNFLLLFMYLWTTKFVKNNHIKSRIFFVFLKNALKQTWNSLNTKFQPHWKDWKSSYQVRQIAGHFFHLIHCTENHIFFFQTSWKDDVSKKNCAAIWSFLYYRERWYSFFPKILPLRRKVKDDLSQKNMRKYFLQTFWKDGLF